MGLCQTRFHLHALKKLQAEGKVVLEKVEQTGLRTSSIFNITEEGKQELHQLLVQSLADSSVVFPATLYTALTFLENLDDDEAITALERTKKTSHRALSPHEAQFRNKNRGIGLFASNSRTDLSKHV